MLADQMVMLHDGRLIARGTPAELERSDEPLVRAFMHSDHSG
jgi:ABC-type transporter Mla maintaining outer membrane lipid asymmetry ATPase subunit MlaF